MLAVSMVSLPPLGMASLALIARFMITCSICPGSTSTCHNAGSGIVNNSTSSPTRRPSIFSIPVNSSLRSRTLGVIICLRLKARSCLVRDAALSPAFLVSSIPLRKDSSLMTSINASWALPMMTVSRLLKSCATPPARVPIASIFWACRNCSSSFVCSVISFTIVRTPVGLPSASFNRLTDINAGYDLPSFLICSISHVHEPSVFTLLKPFVYLSSSCFLSKSTNFIPIISSGE